MEKYRIPHEVGRLLDAAHAEVHAAECALIDKRAKLHAMARVYLAPLGIGDADPVAVHRDDQGWFHVVLESPGD